MAEIKSQRFLCVDLELNTQNTFLTVGEGKNGRLTMVEDGEKFVFEEGARVAHTRNTRVWSGHRINVSRDLFGNYRVNLRHLELSSKTDAAKVGREILNELKNAKEELGL